MLLAVTFKRRKEPTRIMFWTQLTAGFWLTLALANHLLLEWTTNLFPGGDNRLDRLLVYARISGILWTLETLLFLSFAVLFLMSCRSRTATDSSP
jgi:hypothetical protein